MLSVTYRKLALTDCVSTTSIRDIVNSTPDYWEGGEETIQEFESIAQQYWSHCRSTARFIVHDYDAADEVVQIAFIKAYCALYDFSPQEIGNLQVGSWLDTIVLNEAIDYIRSQHKLLQVDDRDSWLYRRETSDYDNPEKIVITSEDKGGLDYLLSKLPKQYRQVIEDIVLYGFSYAFLTKREGSDVRTIRTRFHRAVQYLARIVKQEQVSEGELRKWLEVWKNAVAENEPDNLEIDLSDFEGRPSDRGLHRQTRKMVEEIEPF